MCLAAWATAQEPPAEARNAAGKIDLVEGALTITGADRRRRAAKLGDLLYEGDTIVTAADGELHAEMTDGGVIAVRANTQLRITKYQANGAATDTSVFSLLKGSFRSITGWIGKNNPSGYQVRTPTATVGVRGTDHEPLVIPQGAREGDPGTYDRVNAGGSFISGKTGRVDVAPGRAGFFAHHGRDKPRVLDQVPVFFRATRHEVRLAGRHEQVRQGLDQRRAERQKAVRERRQGPGERGAGRARAEHEQKQTAGSPGKDRRDERREQNRQRVDVQREQGRAQQDARRQVLMREQQQQSQQQGQQRAQQQAQQQAQQRRLERQNQGERGPRPPHEAGPARKGG